MWKSIFQTCFLVTSTISFQQFHWSTFRKNTGSNSFQKLILKASTETSITSEKKAPYSFVQDDLRAYAMKLHTRDQSPREGQQPAQTPITQWEPSRGNYLSFLVDSLKVYETLEAITHEYPVLDPLRVTGLERSEALRKDIEWMVNYDKTLIVPSCGAGNYFSYFMLNGISGGIAYSDFLQNIVKESIPKFMVLYLYLIIIK